MNRQGKIRYGFALTMFSLLLAITATVIAAPNIKGKGTLNAVEEQGKIVVITTQGDSIDKIERQYTASYQVSSYAIILDGWGRKTTLDKYRIPSKVEFEIEYAPSGAVIKRIREIPQ